MSAPSSHSAGESRRPSHKSARYWACLLAVVCAAQFVVLMLLLRPGGQSGSGGPRGPSPYSATNREPYFAGHAGPWGELEYVRINLELPEEFIESERQGLRPTRWFFAVTTGAQLRAFLAGCGLTAAQRAQLEDTNRWAIQPDGILLSPSSDLVISLTPESRARIYSLLAQNSRNDLHAWPFTYRQGGFGDWFGQSGLTAETLALVEKVVYSRGTALCVSDLPALCERISDPAEEWRLIKSLSRTSALLMRVRVHPATDVKSLAAYWARGWHVKDIESLLESLTKVPQSITVDVAHLLPPFARKRINSYPAPLAPGQRPPDCYWTAFNFFNDPPDDRYFDDAIWRQELQAQFQLVERPIFGDLVFLVRPDGVPIHCANFVADDVVFTKNGANPKQPWKLMKIEDMLARYPEDYPLRIAYFRPLIQRK